MARQLRIQPVLKKTRLRKSKRKIFPKLANCGLAKAKDANRKPLQQDLIRACGRVGCQFCGGKMAYKFADRIIKYGNGIKDKGKQIVLGWDALDIHYKDIPKTKAALNAIDKLVLQ